MGSASARPGLGNDLRECRRTPLHLRFFISSPGDVSEERLLARALIGELAVSPAFKGKLTTEVIAWDDAHAAVPMDATVTPQTSVNHYAGLPSTCDLTLVFLWSRIGTPLPAVHRRANGTRYESGTVWELEDAQNAGKPIWIYRRTSPPTVALDDLRIAEKQAAFAEVKRFFTRFTDTGNAIVGGINTYLDPEELRGSLRQHLEVFVTKRLEMSLMLASESSAAHSFFPPDIKPNLPNQWVPRPELKELERRLLATRGGAVAVTTPFDDGGGQDAPKSDEGARTALRGGGGFGKTALAIAACHARRVIDAFPDGILWITLGQTPDVPRLLKEQLGCITKTETSLNDLEAESAWRHLLCDKRMLLVLDDVWEAGHVHPFLVPTRGATLLTTRIASLPNDLNAVELRIERMDHATGSDLLLQWVPQDARDVSALGPLVDTLDGWPLLLKLVGAYIGQHVGAGRSLAAAVAATQGRLREFGPGAFTNCSRSVHARERSAEACLLLCFSSANVAGAGSSSTMDLLRARFEELCVFAEDTNIPISAVARLWRETAQLTSADTEEALLQLHDFAMFESFDLGEEHGHVRLHDVVRSLLRVRRRHDLQALHEKLLQSYQIAHFAELPRNEPYIFTHLASHMQDARGRDALRELLLDPRWLRAKLEVAGVDALLADFRVFGVRDRLHRLRKQSCISSEDALVNELFECLQLSASALHRSAEELEVQLLGRLNQDDEERQTLQRMLISQLRVPYAMLRHPSLERSGGTLLAALAGHSASIKGATLLRNADCAISWSADKTLKIWDLHTGQCTHTLQGHTNWVSGALLLNQDARALSWSADKTLKLWDLHTGQCTRTLQGHTNWVSGALRLDDDARALSWSTDKTLRLWNLRSGQCTYILEGHGWPVGGALLVNNGGGALSWSEDKTLKLWDLRSGQCRFTLRGHTNAVWGALLFDNGTCALSWSDDKTLRLWDLSNGECTGMLEGHTSGVIGTMLLNDGRHVLSWSYDNSLKLWDLRERECIHTLESHTRWVNGALLLDDATRALSWSHDATLKLWDLSSGQCTHTLRGHRKAVGGALLVDNDSRALSWSDDHRLKLWDLSSGQCTRTFTGHGSVVHESVLLDHGARALSWSADRSLKLWDLNSEQRTHNEGHGSRVNGALRVDDTHVLSWSGDDSSLKLWDLSSGQCVRVLDGHDDLVVGALLVRDGACALSWSRDNTLKLWDLRSGQCMFTLKGHSDIVLGARLLADGARVLSWGRDNCLRLWNLQTGQCMRIGRADSVYGLVLLDDGVHALHWSRGRRLELWNLNTWRWTRTIEGPASWVNGALLLNKDTRALSWGHNESLNVWDLSNGRCTHTLSGHASWVNGALLVDGGSRALSWSADGTLKLWDLHAGQCLHSLDGHGGSVYGALLLDNGALSLSWSADNTLKLWDLHSGQCIHTIEAHRAFVTGVLLLDGARALSWSADNTIKLWEVMTAKCISTLTMDAPASVAIASSPTTLFVGDELGGVHVIDVTWRNPGGTSRATQADAAVSRKYLSRGQQSM